MSWPRIVVTLNERKYAPKKQSTTFNKTPERISLLFEVVIVHQESKYKAQLRIKPSTSRCREAAVSLSKAVFGVLRFVSSLADHVR